MRMIKVTIVRRHEPTGVSVRVHPPQLELVDLARIVNVTRMTTGSRLTLETGQKIDVIERYEDVVAGIRLVQSA